MCEMNTQGHGVWLLERGEAIFASRRRYLYFLSREAGRQFCETAGGGKGEEQA